MLIFDLIKRVIWQCISCFYASKSKMQIDLKETGDFEYVCEKENR